MTVFDEKVEYLVGHCSENEGQNPFGQDHVLDILEEMDALDLQGIAYAAIWKLANL